MRRSTATRCWGRICAAIAGDEARHEKAYIKIVDALFERCGIVVFTSVSGLLLCFDQATLSLKL